MAVLLRGHDAAYFRAFKRTPRPLFLRVRRKKAILGSTLAVSCVESRIPPALEHRQ
jgi:hypothetical protein